MISLVVIVVITIVSNSRIAIAAIPIVKEAGEQASQLQRNMTTEMISTILFHFNNIQSADDIEEANFEMKAANTMLSGLIGGLTIANNNSSNPPLSNAISDLEESRITLTNNYVAEAERILRFTNSTIFA